MLRLTARAVPLAGRLAPLAVLLVTALGCAAPEPRPTPPRDPAATSFRAAAPGTLRAAQYLLTAEPTVDRPHEVPLAAPHEVPVVAPDDTPIDMPLVGLSGAPLPAGIDARTQELLDALRLRYQEHPRVRFQLVETVERLDEHGRKVQATHLRSGTSARPDRLVMTVEGDLQRLGIWKSGGVITVLDRQSNTWRSLPDDGTPEILADLLAIDGVPMLPFRFFLEDDPADALLQGVVSGEYLGVHQVNEIACDHIILSTLTHDRQLWIETEGRRRAIKLVETFRDLPGQPQYELRLEISTTIDSVPDSLFVFEPPEGAVQVVDDVPSAAEGSTPAGDGEG